MVTLHYDDGTEGILLGSDDATFEILTCCEDADGQTPAQVHLIIEPVPGTRILNRSTGRWRWRG